MTATDMPRMRTLLILLLLAGCGTSGNAPVPADPAAPDWGVLNGNGDSSSTGSPLAWPGSPGWATAYPGAVVDVADGNAASGTISFRSTDPPGRVIDFYRQACRRAGLPLNRDGMALELAAGDERRTLLVNAAALGSGSVVSLVYRAS